MKAVICLLAISTILIGFTVNAADSECQRRQCVAVVDAGSSGSRLHIYAYDVDQSNTPINIKELWLRKVNPGLATLKPNQETIDAYLSNLFSKAPENNLPLYFYATAGMRLLPSPKQKQYYNLIQNWFSNQTQWQLQNVKTITGNEEGLYDWLAVNYQLGTLDSNKGPAVGVMDMGGASVQIAFPIEKTEGLIPSDVKQLNLYGRHLQLFIHSFLGIGQTEVTHQYLDADSCFANEYELPNGLTAAGEAITCKAEVASLLNGVHGVNRIVQPALTENLVHDWYVIGGLADLAQSQPFQFANHQFTNETLLDQANTQVCHQQWPSLTSQYPDSEYLFGYCLFPAYYYALMVDGYGIQPQQVINFLATTDWPLGFVLLQKPKNKMI